MSDLSSQMCVIISVLKIRTVVVMSKDKFSLHPCVRLWSYSRSGIDKDMVVRENLAAYCRQLFANLNRLRQVLHPSECLHARSNFIVFFSILDFLCSAVGVSVIFIF